MIQQLDKIRGMEVRISPQDREAILLGMREVLDSGYLMWGAWQERLCTEFQALTGRTHAVTFNSCSSALEVLFRYMASRPRQDKRPWRVCFQANVFPSPVFAARRAGVDVAFCDIDVVEMCPTVEQLEECWQFKPFGGPFDALVLQWTAGFIPESVDAIWQWTRDRGVFLIEDASHAAGSVQAHRPAGSFGDVSVFSLAATKPLQCGQGGMMLTDDPKLAEYAFQMKNYGRTEMFQRGEYVQEGSNLHMTELQAVVGVVLMGSMWKAISRRRVLAEMMLHPVEQWYKRLGSWTGGSCAPNLYKLPVLPMATTRPKVYKAFEDLNIEPGSLVYSFTTPYLEVLAGARDRWISRFPKCEEFANRHVCIPMHNGMTEADAERVALALGNAVDK